MHLQFHRFLFAVDEPIWFSSRCQLLSINYISNFSNFFFPAEWQNLRGPFHKITKEKNWKEHSAWVNFTIVRKSISIVNVHSLCMLSPPWKFWKWFLDIYQRFMILTFGEIFLRQQIIRWISCFHPDSG